MSDDRAGSRVAAVLEGLALQNASGELEIDGSPGGAIYLDRGEITFARSACSPDLAARLRGALGLAAGLRDLLAAEDRPAGDLGGQLVRRGYLSAAELESILRSVILDAVIVLTVPLSADAVISGIRLVSGVSHWAGAFGRLNVAAIRAEAARRGRQMSALGLGQGGAPLQLQDMAGGPAVLTSRQRQFACIMNGSETARDLAWDNGLALHETAECAGALASAGLCATVPVPARAPGPRASKSGPQPKAVSGLAPGRVTARGVTTRARLPKAATGGSGGPGGIRPAMPRPPAAADAITGGADPGPESAEEADFSPVSVESLRRVLDGLRRLS